MIELLLAIILSIILSQIIDFVITSIKSKKIILNRLWETGGFPSSHTAGVSSLVTGVYLIDGFNLSFIISLCLFAVVIRDAMGVRYEVGKHAKLLNQKYHTKFNEKSGHTPLEVIGGIVFGIVLTLILV